MSRSPSTLSSSPSLRVLVIGAGAIGTYIGGSLALHGHNVVFLERPEVAAALRQRGMRLTLPDGEHRIPHPTVAASLDEALRQGAFDVALFALKSYDTRPALEGMRAHRDALPPFLCLQNGVENESVLAEFLGAGRVLAGTVTSAVGRRDAGDIRLEKLRGMGVAAGHPLSARLVQALDAAGLRCRLFPRAADMKWSKMLTNLLANASSAILDMTPAEIFAHPGLFRLEMAQLREALAVMRAQGIRAVDLPGTPVRALAFTVRRLPPFIAQPALRRVVGAGRGGKMPSFHIDLHSGRGKSEVSYLNGAVARFGERLGIPTPVNAALTRILEALVRGEASIDAYAKNPRRLLDAVASPAGHG